MQSDHSLVVEVDSAKTNWDRLEGDGFQGLLLSLLRMKKDDLDILSAILGYSSCEMGGSI